MQETRLGIAGFVVIGLLCSATLLHGQQEEETIKMVKNQAGEASQAIVAIKDVCAWPNLTVLPDGTIVATIHNQPSHLKQPSDVECWASEDGGQTWKKRGTPAPRENPNVARGNVAAGLAGNGDLIVISSGWSDPTAARGRGTILPLLVSRSTDGGRTWDVDDNAFPGSWPDIARRNSSPEGYLVPFGDILSGDDGRLRVGLYSGNRGATFVYTSRDDGKTWREPVNISRDTVINEPALIHLGEGRWLCAARLAGLDLYHSEDDAQSWIRRGKLTGAEQHPGHLMRMKDGTILLSYGNRQNPRGVDVRFSDDDGESWSEPFRVLGFQGDGGYPSSVQLSDGRILTAYYAQRIPGFNRYHMGVVIWDPEKTRGETVPAVDMDIWQNRAVDHARIMSQVKWTPVADGIPIRGRGEFKADATCTGVPYSNGGWDGRLIGFDIHLKTFLAAAENPLSVLYTKDLRGQRRNSAAFYGMVCSAYTSYALQLAVQVGSSFHGAPYRDGIEPAHPQSAQGAQVGDVLWFSGHVEIVTRVTTARDGRVTHVRVEDSWPPTTRTKNYTATRFNAYLAQQKATLYRITDHDAWRGENRAEHFLFPNYEMDAETPIINRVLLLDLGDWVAYRKGQPVVFNIMDQDNRGVKTLVIKREGDLVEQIALDGPGIVERAFTRPGDYTAHCIMKDGTSSQACEFSVCVLDSRPLTDPVILGKPLEIEFRTENMKAIHVQIAVAGDPDYADPVAPHCIWLSDEHHRQGRVTVPADVLTRTGKYSVYITGEDLYGRLRNRHVIAVVKPE